MTRVVIADDHPPTRSSLRRALEEGTMQVVGEAFDASSAVHAVSTNDPDVAVLDVRMPGGGIAAAAAIQRLSPATAVVMLTVSADDEDLFAALRVGALGYLLKGGDPAALPSVLRRVVEGEAALDGMLLTKLLAEFRTVEHRRILGRDRRERLSERELGILALLERGASTSQIAEQLFIAKVTVRSHIASICRKLRLPDRESVVRALADSCILVEAEQGSDASPRR